MGDTVRTGDRVLIKGVRDHSASRFLGVRATVEHAYTNGIANFAVLTDGGMRVVATAVEKIDDVVRPTSHSLTASERALYATENHSWRDEASELDRRRTQAAEFAHRILGADALLEDVIGLADWILDNPEASAKDIKRVTFNPGGVIFPPDDAETTRRLAEGLAKSGRIVATSVEKADDANEPLPVEQRVSVVEHQLGWAFDRLDTVERDYATRAAGLGPVAATIDEVAPTAPRPPANLEIRDKDGDCLHLAYTHTLAGIVAVIDARSHGDVCATYVNAEDADRIIAFLQAAKAAKA